MWIRKIIIYIWSVYLIKYTKHYGRKCYFTELYCVARQCKKSRYFGIKYEIQRFEGLKLHNKMKCIDGWIMDIDRIELCCFSRPAIDFQPTAQVEERVKSSTTSPCARAIFTIAVQGLDFRLEAHVRACMWGQAARQPGMLLAALPLQTLVCIHTWHYTDYTKVL
jgi:hypothetical protein